jgi:hypothetical protein
LQETRRKENTVRILNKSKWNTKDIARLIRRVAQDEIEPGHLKHARVKIKHGKRREVCKPGYGGYCAYGSMIRPNVWMAIELPAKDTEIDSVLVAKIIAHELGHSKGITHRDMNNIRYGWKDGWREQYAYASEYPIRPKPVKAKPEKIDLVQKKRDRAVAMVSKYESRIKRHTTILRRWQKQARYYEGRVAACASSKSLVNVESAPLTTV